MIPGIKKKKTYTFYFTLLYLPFWGSWRGPQNYMNNNKNRSEYVRYFAAVEKWVTNY
jgi:hypothetical protein